MKKGKWWLIGLATIMLIILGIGGKQYMDKKAIEKDYQQGIDLIQKYVSNYLVENYEGIEKIEWQGIGVEWRNAKGYGPSLLGNYVDSDVKVYVSEDKYFMSDFRLSEKGEYKDELKKYVLSKTLNPENTDGTIEVGLENAVYGLSQEEKKLFEKFKKSDKGSPNAKVVYNIEIHELIY
ncbi:hypothetical protein [Enterococcus faecalis]|uniref:hypothetical protein n=2 Tax=Enterococcus faecalis TaxID=1351 RepID=UPI000A1922A1|nr:hypothetical protein [Enterococcus faecalis]OSH33545.1 hypothetical protein WZ211_0629 [Enterococcus faecalis]OSH46877.1 hypothetical protein YM392_0739 [Enterococcus faecalis]